MISCPKCGADNKENSKFCETCGEKLNAGSKFCPECGKENVEIAKFCDNCGTSLETSGSGKDIQANIPENNSDQIVSLNLTPAESIVLIDHKGYDASTQNLLKVTLIDLVFKNVFKLDVHEVEKKGLFGKKMVKKIYLEEGKNFSMPLKPHEEVFRDNLPSKADSKRLKKLQQRVFGKYRNNFAKKKVIKPLALEGYFNEEKKFMGKKYTLSDKGIETRQMILELKEQGRDLDSWIDTDPERARAYLLMGGSNVFLTDDYYFEWFKNNSNKIRNLFIGVAIGATAYHFSHVRWYGTFKVHGVDFDDFDDFGGGIDFDDFGDIFADSDFFDAFDSMDEAAFDSFEAGFDSGGGDFGGDGGGGGE